MALSLELIIIYSKLYMPYYIKPVGKGFKVAKVNEPKKVFSIKPLTHKKAKAQMTAIILSEIKRGKLK